MMIDWNAYHAQIIKGIAEIGRSSVEIVRGYRTISGAGAVTNALDAKTRELISVAVGVVLECDGCIVSHIDAALKNGATREEIVEALGVAITVKAGSALIFSTRALDAMNAKLEQQTQQGS